MQTTSSSDNSEKRTIETRYELTLRKLGAWLDAAFGYGIVVVEVYGGFVVRYHQREMEPVFVERLFPDSEIRSLRLGDLRLRRRISGRLGHRIQGMAREPGGYQDLFRALGHELDVTEAQGVRLLENEEEDTLIMTFQKPGAEPQRIVFGSDDRAVARVHARSRREERNRLSKFW